MKFYTDSETLVRLKQKIREELPNIRFDDVSHPLNLTLCGIFLTGIVLSPFYLMHSCAVMDENRKIAALANEPPHVAPTAAQMEAARQRQEKRKACDSPKKNGAWDARPNDLAELAQDWLSFKRQLLANPQDEDAHRNFDKANVYLDEYPDEAVAKCVESFE